MDIARLPFIDEHTRDVAVDASDLWLALLTAIDGSLAPPGAAVAARALGCDDRDAGGPRPFAPGSTVPGFRVTSVVPGSELVLEGRHRFSTYAVVFRVEPAGPGRSRLRAESRAEFPGPAGRVYRTLVIGSGGHVVAVRRMLRGITRRAEAHAGADLTHRA